MLDLLSHRSAVLSDDRRYRYRLERDADLHGPTAAFVMVNPSTADAEADDATIRKVMGFSRRHGFGRVLVGNLFAYRATDIGDLAPMSIAAAVGPDNDEALRAIMADADRVIFAWGASGKLPRQLRPRWKAAALIADEAERDPWCFGTSLDGHPRHPLMLGYASDLVRWFAPEAGQ
jgi:hypothetical protein